MNIMTNKFFKATTALAVAVAMFGCGGGDAGGDAQKATADTTVAPVRDAFLLQKGKLDAALQLPGELIAYQQVDIYAKDNSFVKKLYADVGSEVSQGQLLAEMEAPELSSQLAAAQSKLKAQEALYIANKANYDRLYETSQTPGTISQNDLDQALAKKNSDYAQLEAAKASYEEVAATRNYLEIRAPFGGVISARNVNTGAYVGPSGKGSEFPMFTLQQQKRLRLVVSVPEAYTNFLTTNSTITFSVRAIPNQKFTAKVTRLAGALDTRLRAEHVEMDVFNDDKKLLPGMVAEVDLPTPAKDSTFIIPKSALVNSTERIFVIRVNNNKVEWVDVKPGRESDGKIEVYGNLNVNDTILSEPSDEIRNGADIKGVQVKHVQ
ncbi:MAG TPA: efflux RND transporter periplasmic adaptor subunit [Chitinophagaceae bacterium]|nr:efflux RND transporter periplasmic adaptor subunit [Chitinophagaceae bacterium]